MGSIEARDEDAHLESKSLTLCHLLINQILHLRLQDVHLELQQREQRNNIHRRIGGHVKVDERVRMLRVSALGQQLLLVQRL